MLPKQKNKLKLFGDKSIIGILVIAAKKKSKLNARNAMAYPVF